MRETRRRFADERLGDRLDESMASGGARVVEGRANRVGAAFPQVFKLMADEKSHQVGHSEARDHARRAVADSGRVIEGRVKLGAR